MRISLPMVFSAKICPTVFDLYKSIYDKCLCVVLVIIRECCMWPNGYFTSSAFVVTHRHCPHTPPLSSSAVVLVVHSRRPSVCQKSALPHFVCYIRRFPRQNLSPIYPLQRLDIRTSAFYYWWFCGCTFVGAIQWMTRGDLITCFSRLRDESLCI